MSIDNLQTTGSLHGSILDVSDVGEVERLEMYRLLTRFFAGVTRERFERDFAEKNWAIVLRDEATRRLAGFSTLMSRRISIGGEPIVGFYSGDTIIAPDHWGYTELPRLWSQHVFRVAEDITDARVYWLLIAGGYKTYRFLPVFFQEFYPTCRGPTPPEMQKRIDALATLKYGDAYDTARGVVEFDEPSPLREGVADITARRLKDPHVAFFIRANPRHAAGDELACITEITRANLTPAGRRMVEGAQSARVRSPE